MSKAIELCNIKQKFKEQVVLNRINLTIEEGEIFGLLGPSGAGKTTMINILTGQLHQSAGTAYLMGQDTLDLKGDAYKKLGMMLDNMGLYQRLTCFDNLMLLARIFRLDKHRVEEALEQVGLTEDANKPVAKLSKGMRQRLLFARAILNNPSILFLDEPTSGLDPVNAEQIHDIIRRQQQNHTTVFLTTHNMEEAAKLSTHIALLHQGNIVEYGTPEEISNRYDHLNQLQLVLKNGQSVLVANDVSGADKVYGYMKENLVQTIHSSEPDLGAVFMELTGKGLNR